VLGLILPAAFETIVRVPTDGRMPLFGADNLLLSGTDYPDVVFRKGVFHRDDEGRGQNMPRTPA
jgi:hypothetical protein